MSSLGRPAAAVRMMTPPVKPCCSRNSRTMPRRRPRSSRESILRETPTWSTVGMNTRKRPGMVACEVRRAPFVPSGSLATWTMISCPSFRSSSIFGSGPFSRSRSRSPRHRHSPASRPARPTRGVPPPMRRWRWPAATIVVIRVEAVELLERRDDVRDVEEAVAFETEVNERRLHAGQHFRYPALVQIANDTARALALDEDFGDLIFLENRDPCFVGARGDDHLLGHARNSAGLRRHDFPRHPLRR